MKLIAVNSLILFFSLCMGCARNNTTDMMRISQNCSQAFLTSQMDQLRKKHSLHITALGDYIFFTLPTDQFFYKNSAHLDPEKIEGLNQLAYFLRCYKKITVTVVAHVSHFHNERENKAFALMQAKAIVHTLWRQGVCGSIMVAKGMSEEKGVDYIQIETKQLP